MSLPCGNEADVEESGLPEYYSSHFNRIQFMMLARPRLASHLCQVAAVLRSLGFSVLHDLIELCKQNSGGMLAWFGAGEVSPLRRFGM